MNNKGEISSFETQMEPAVKEILFTRLPPAFELTKNDLQPYLGEYELSGMVVKFYIQGENTLKLTVPGQPEYEMIPIRKHEFEFKTPKGFSIKFEVDDRNEATAVTFYQPNGIFTAKRKK